MFLFRKSADCAVQRGLEISGAAPHLKRITLHRNAPAAFLHGAATSFEHDIANVAVQDLFRLKTGI